MSAHAILSALMAGHPDAERRLLNSCACEGWNTHAYGRYAVARLFQRHARPLSPHAQVVTGQRSLAMFDTDEGGSRAVIADVFDGNVGRLWVIDGRSSVVRPVMTIVPFDPDLSQVEPQIAFRAEDHPELAVDAASATQGLIANWKQRGLAEAGLDPRAFALRAFSAGDFHVLLAAAHDRGLAAEGVGPWNYAALLFRFQDERAASASVFGLPSLSVDGGGETHGSVK